MRTFKIGYAAGTGEACVKLSGLGDEAELGERVGGSPGVGGGGNPRVRGGGGLDPGRRKGVQGIAILGIEEDLLASGIQQQPVRTPFHPGIAI